MYSIVAYFNNPSYVQLNSLKAFALKLAQLEAINKIKMKIATEYSTYPLVVHQMQPLSEMQHQSCLPAPSVNFLAHMILNSPATTKCIRSWASAKTSIISLCETTNALQLHQLLRIPLNCNTHFVIGMDGQDQSSIRVPIFKGPQIKWFFLAN